MQCATRGQNEGEKQLALLKGHSAPVNCVAWSSEHTCLSGSADGTVRVWDVRSGRVARGLKCGRAVDMVVPDVSEGGHVLVLAACGRDVLAFDLRAPGVVLPCTHSAEAVAEDDIAQLAVNKRFVATCDDAGNVAVYEKRYGGPIAAAAAAATTMMTPFKRMQRAHGGSIVACVRFRPSRMYDVVTGGLDSKVVLWDASKGKKAWTLDLSTAVIDGDNNDNALGPMVNPPYANDVAYSAAGDRLAVAAGSGDVFLVDAGKGTVLQRGSGGHSYSVASW